MTQTRSFLVPMAALALAVVGIVVAIKIVLRIPGIPYNVSELFLDNASVTALVFFALAVVWIGAGAMTVATVVTRSRRPYVVLPIALLVAALVSKMLISRGATYESLDDILGSNNMFGLVTQQGIWGAWWKQAFLTAGVDLVDFIERRVRYCALYSVPLVMIVAALLPQAATTAIRRHGILAWVLMAAVAVVWLALSGAIALTYAATDNLTELIAAPMYLLALLALMACNVALLLWARRSVRRWIVTLVAFAAAVSMTWFLLNAGLEPRVHKYSAVFSGAQFLLGPDRNHALSTTTLFARWAVLYVGGVAVIWFGAWLARTLADALGATSRRSAVPEAS